MIGKIIKGIGGFYYVAAEDGIIYETRARGLFRKEGIRPSVGDDCEIEIQDAEKRTGSVISILPRRAILRRPAVANTDQAIVIFAVSRPEPHFGLMDRYLTGMLWQEMPVTLVLNKIDQDRNRGNELQSIYTHAGFNVILTSAKKTGKVVTVEEHSVIGGLGSAVSDALSESAPTPVKKLGMQDKYGESGTAGELVHKYGLDADGVYASVKEFLK